MRNRLEQPTDGKIHLNKEFGSWTVEKYLGKLHGKTASVDQWECRCVCGTVRAVPRYNLLKGTSTQCFSCACKKLAESRRQAASPWGIARFPRAWAIWNAYSRKNPDIKAAWGSGAVFVEWFMTYDPKPPERAVLCKKNPKLPHSPTNSFPGMRTTKLEAAIRYIATVLNRPLAEVVAASKLLRRQGIYAKAARLRSRELRGLPIDEKFRSPGRKPFALHEAERKASAAGLPAPTRAEFQAVSGWTVPHGDKALQLTAAEIEAGRLFAKMMKTPPKPATTAVNLKPISAADVAERDCSNSHG